MKINRTTQIKLFQEDYLSTMESEINSFLKTKENIEVIDIKTKLNGEGYYKHSATIIYKEKSDD